MIANQEAKTASRSNHLTVYLDQSVYGRMLDDASDWQRSEIGSILLDAQSTGIAQVWAGPTNVIETVQASETSRRKALAAMMLDLIENRRMWWGHEFEAIQDFFQFVTKFAPKALSRPEYFESHGIVARQTWLGALALVAATDGSHLGPVAQQLRHTKATNRLLHARFALAPDDWVTNMVEAAQTLKVTDADPLAELDQLSTEQIEAEIASLTEGAQKLSGSGSVRLDKFRQTIAAAYGCIEIGALLNAVFTLPLELELTFDIQHIVEMWENFQTATGCQPLPKEVRDADKLELLGNVEFAHTVITHLIRSAARKGLMTTSLGVQVILREMQRCMNNKLLPTGGLSFDADHASALVRHHVFVTHDEWLGASLKTMAKMIETTTGGQWQPKIAESSKQLAKALSGPLPR